MVSRRDGVDHLRLTRSRGSVRLDKMQWVMGGLSISTGLIAAAVGVAMARHGLQTAQRLHARTSSLSLAVPDGWGSWFLGGFTSLSIGFRWIAAVAAWLVWTLAGLALVWLGIRLI